MTQNDILRRLRYIFDYNDLKMMSIFGLTKYPVKEKNVKDWLRKEDDPLFLKMHDRDLAAFLNGLIIERRGKREGPLPEAEEYLNNNMILRKLKIAFDLQTDDVLALFSLAGKKISKNELSAFFRNSHHSSYRPCMDQYLRSFLTGLQMRYKGKFKK